VKPYVLQPGTIPHRAYEWLAHQTRVRSDAGADRFTCTTAEFNEALNTGLDDATFITCLKKARDWGFFLVDHDHGANGRKRLRWALGDGKRAAIATFADDEGDDGPLHNAADIRIPSEPTSPLPTGQTVAIEKPAQDEPSRPRGRPPVPCPLGEVTGNGPGWTFNGKVAPPPPAPEPAPAPAWPLIRTGQTTAADPEAPRVHSAWPLIEHQPRPSEFMAGRTDDDCLIVERDGRRVRFTPDETRVIARVTRGIA
jgi:hypothetical protein